MRIREIHVYSHTLPVKDGPYVMASTVVDVLETTLVRIVDETGAVGWGETCPVGPVYAPAHAAGALAAIKEIAPGLIGADVTGLRAFQRLMDKRLNGHAYAKAAFDIAAHDLLGKRTGLSVADLLGGAMTEKVPSYFASGVGSPEDIARIAKDKADQGFKRMQIKVGGRAVDLDIETIRKVWEAVGTRMRLIVDGNRGWTSQEALRVSRSCLDIPIVLEQPCNTIEEVARIRHQLGHGVYLDESATDISAVVRAIGDGICDGFGMKLTRIGGLQPMSVFRDICEAAALPHTCDDSWGGDIIAAACVQIAATVHPKFLEGVWIAQPYIDGNYDSHNPVNIVDGHLNVPAGPGLGVVPDEALFGAPVASF
ncbi:mandelate racemase/muconate lactonizing enzyme family protein [Roseibium alexandrii]